MCTAPQEFHTGGRRDPGVVLGVDDEGWKERRQSEVCSCPTDYSVYNMVRILFIYLHHQISGMYLNCDQWRQNLHG